MNLFRADRLERPAFMLYSAAVAAARAPVLYEALGAPDTLDGRFDLIGLHVALLIHRLRRLPSPGPRLAQAVFDAMFSDMDISLREIGVGDLSVGKRVRAMWEAFHGRAAAYEAPFTTHDAPALAAALARNVWRGAAVPQLAEGDAAAALARLALAQCDALAEQPIDALAAGRVRFLDAATLLA